MKFFLDTEFIEGFKKPISWLPTIGNFNKSYHSIQLVSIGLVCEDGREYYAISNEFKISDASKWVWDNVLHGIYKELLPKENYARTYHWDLVEPFNKKTLATLIKWHGKSNYQIANEIVNFVHGYSDMGDWVGSGDDYFKFMRRAEPKDKPEFYAYYADYDWVLLCSLFGTMMDLPKGFPMYCNDLKQAIDEVCDRRKMIYINNWKDGGRVDAELVVANDLINERFKTATKQERLDIIKSLAEYPSQTHEHNALSDAKFNFELYKLIQKL